MPEAGGQRLEARGQRLEAGGWRLEARISSVKLVVNQTLFTPLISQSAMVLCASHSSVVAMGISRSVHKVLTNGGHRRAHCI